MTALEYLCRLAVEAQHTAFRSQRGGFQSTASVQNRQGEDQALTLRANTFARSHRKLIFNLHHALHKTGHVPGIQIDCPGAHRPKTEHTRYTCLTPPASMGHKLTFLMTETNQRRNQRNRAIQVKTRMQQLIQYAEKVFCPHKPENYPQSTSPFSTIQDYFAKRC